MGDSLKIKNNKFTSHIKSNKNKDLYGDLTSLKYYVSL